jgi:beta-glucosidase
VDAVSVRSSRWQMTARWLGAFCGHTAGVGDDDGGDFWWGVTTTSLQTEGVAPASDWSRWERDRRVPASGDGNGFATNHADDLALLASLGLTHIRLTLEWARLEPEPGRIDADAFDRYQDILASAEQAGLEVIATMVSGSLPGWFTDDTRGFRDEHERQLTWARHVDRLAERFDHQVAVWVPIDDPIGWALRGFGLGTRPPGRRDPEQTAEAIEGALLANHRAWELLRSGDTPVMAVFGTPTIFAHGPDTDVARRQWHDTIYGAWISALRDGELLIPNMAPRERPELAGAFDLIGIVHDHPIGIDRTGAVHPYPDDGRRTDVGFTPIPNELGELLSYLAAELPARDLVVAGHGIATADDEWRERILQETVDLITDAADHDIPVRGYFHDTGIDGYEGPYGFSTSRGLVTRSRDLKDSARWLQSRLRD